MCDFLFLFLWIYISIEKSNVQKAVNVRKYIVENAY